MSNAPLFGTTRTRRDLNQVLQTIASIATDLAEIVADIATLEGEMDRAQGDIDNLEAADIALDGRLDTAEGNIITLDGRLDTAEPEIDALQAADVALDGRLDTAEGEIDALQSNVASLDGRLDSAEADAAVLGSDSAPDGRVLTADGAGGAAWEALPALANHDHSGDAGDGGTFDAGNLTSGLASDGHVLTADGSGGAAWEAPAADVLWSTLQGLQLCNEVKAFPALIPMDTDLNAQNQWWDIIGTPTTPVQMVDTAGDFLTENFEWALKTVCDASSEGFYQRYTYADEPRIKSGRKLSAIAAVWLATAGRTITMRLRTSSASVVFASNSMDSAWVLLKCEGLTLNGSYVDLQFEINGSGTFYVVPLGVNIGTKAVALPPRGMIYRECTGVTMLVNGVDPGGASFTDIDCTAASSALACKLNLWGLYRNATRIDQTLSVRRNGDTTGWGQSALVRSQSTTAYTAGTQICVCDDQQIVEYMTNCAAADTEAVYIKLLGWWEWA